MTLVFKPVGILSGLAAGLVAQKIFKLVWGLIDDGDAPEPKYRRLNLWKLALALVLEGAVLRVVRGFAEHGTRHAFTAVAGEWPGEEAPESKEDS